MEHKSDRLGTPLAAGIAGFVFAVLMAVVIILTRLALPAGGGTDSLALDPGQRRAARVALAVLPFAGIAFLWFMGALREQAGAAEDRFVSTVFLGSGLVFVATLFAGAAAAGTVLNETQQQFSSFGRHFAYDLLTTYAMRMAAVFMFTTSSIGRRIGVFPRPLVALGYLAGVTLLVTGAALPWGELVFPGWALIVSMSILRSLHHTHSRPAGRA
ncbi:hypothetical protein [Streptomyces sp. NPDC047028]|uniref:hypothetical protein n=1 Tax=Streptomyces sp. NPDC047028 TaxID=3155793 RepID=UPI0033D765C9